MAEEPVPPLSELDWSDLTFYQHPPCMHSLWYVFTIVNLVWDPVKDAINNLLEMMGLGEGGGGSGGDDGGGGGEGEGEGEGEEGEGEGEAEEEPA